MAVAHEGNFVTVDLSTDAPEPLSPGALALQAAVNEVAEFRSKLQALGEPPDHEYVDEARAAISSINATLASNLEQLHFSESESSAKDRKEQDIRDAAERAKLPYQAVIDTYELYHSYESLLKAAELNMMKLSGEPEVLLPLLDEEDVNLGDGEEVNEEVRRTFVAAKEGTIKDVKLNSCNLSRFPDAFGNISTIVSLDLSDNRLKHLPDTLGELVALESLNVEHNSLVVLPDTIGLLKSLKVLILSRNKLTALPESIPQCSCLEILNADFNELEYLPSQIGSGLPNIKHISVRWNKLRSLPTSFCSLRSLRKLELKFNQLKALPQAFGNLINLEYLDVSCNFTALQALPDTVGDLVALSEVDLSCNQIKILPDSFGRLQFVKKINLKDNPLVSPPVEVCEAGTEAIMCFMRNRWLNFLEEERQRYSAEKEQQEKWLPWAINGLSKVFFGGSPHKASNNEDYLCQQL
ncbi:hypothetical protein KP509_14G084900 [Ceratopteris richardii]|uniref:Uncharacterized protein n=2 Tax=Ceratopteris richardii TaxID=49495 RepID=A0A8T2TEX9_CERRI|nr:hypothetical protein KP509_14G084900 [Ceratopteris richardii]